MIDNSLDWMYEGPAAALRQKESSEEYLLGKIFKKKDQDNGATQILNAGAIQYFACKLLLITVY